MHEDSTIRIAIADDHPLLVSSIENVLHTAGYFTIQGTYETGEALLEGLKQSPQPEVLILDYHLPDHNGAKLARQVTYHYPEIKILALSGFEKPGLSTELIESGCAGFLLKTSARQDVLLKAIHTVLDGNIYLDKQLKERFAENIHRTGRLRHREMQSKLTKRELEILALIINELSSQEIAERLFISKKTVDNHRSSILMKTGAKNNFALMKIAMELNLV